VALEDETEVLVLHELRYLFGDLRPQMRIRYSLDEVVYVGHTLHRTGVAAYGCWLASLVEVGLAEESSWLVDWPRRAGCAGCRSWRVSSTNDSGLPVGDAPPFDAERMIVAINWQRVFAECAAKRRIVDAFRPAAPACWGMLEVMLRELALAREGHPGD
jgi:hypothetical protein